MAPVEAGSDDNDPGGNIMAIRIMTDSASDISQAQAKEWQIKVFPLRIRFGETEYLDGINLSTDSFYEQLENSDVIPKTSQIPPLEYEENFRAAAEAGDDLIYFSISSGVSGSYQTACMVARDYEPYVHIIDSKQFCISQYIIVERAVRLRDEGKNAKEIVEIIREEQKNAHVMAVFNTLHYLKLGGRLSSASAFAGELLSIKPVLTITDGIVQILGKARGLKKSHQMLSEMIEKTGGIDYSRPVCFGYAGNSDANLLQYIKNHGHHFKDNGAGIPIIRVGATIGTYSGPGAIAVSFFSK